MIENWTRATKITKKDVYRKISFLVFYGDWANLTQDQTFKYYASTIDYLKST